MLHDLPVILNWWLLLLFLGIISFPFATIVFAKTFDKGYAFTKTISILIISYLVFVLGTAKILVFSQSSVWVFPILGVIGAAYFAGKHAQAIKKTLQKSWRIILFEEVIFLIALIAWSFARGFNPSIQGLEKFMDFGFLNSILQSKFFPPPDMWMAGETLNYYYFGHLVTAVLTKLSGIPSSITYNLMIATIFALVFTSAFSLILNLLAKNGVKQAFLGGLIAAFLLTLGGNLHTPIYALKNGVENYWYPDATRFVGYSPETEDKTIHEFPGYSFVVADLHAHLINLPFVLLFLFLLFNLIGNWKVEIGKFINILPLGFLLGIFLMTNSWDFLNYGLVATVVIFLVNLKRHSLKKVILQTVITMFGIAGAAILIALPFLVNFTSIAKGVGLVHAHTPLWQLLVLWGGPIIFTTIFLFTLKKTKENIFILALLISAWVLILIPEAIYVKDIYIASHHRANTMFKLTYQAFVLFALTAGYITVKQIQIKNLFLKTITLSLSLLTIASVLTYPYFAIRSFYNNLEKYKGLNGNLWLKQTYPDNFEAVNWLKETYITQPILLEAAGDSYTDYNHISSYTGFPTVQGWLVHEWLWRGSYDEPGKRAQDIQTIYETQSNQTAKTLLNNYSVDLVMIGPLERQKYHTLQEEKFKALGEVVFSNPTFKIYQINPNLD